MSDFRKVNDGLDHIRKFITENTTVRNIAINLIVMLFFIAIGPIFEENDDVAMERIVSGFFEPSYSYIVFENIILGKTFSFLYKLLPFVKWYVLAMYLFIFVSFCVLSCLFDVIIQRGWSAFIKYPFIIMMGYELYSNPQFTKTSAILTVAGFSLLLYICFEEIRGKQFENKRSEIAGYILASILILLGSFIRTKSFYMIIPFVFIVLFREGIIYVTTMQYCKRKIVISFFIFIAVSLVVLGTIFINKLAYNSQEGWRKYTEWRNLRGKTVDFEIPDYYEYEEEYRKIGFSENDYYLLRNWGFGDVDFYTADRLGEIVALKKSGSVDWLDIISKTFSIAIPSMLIGLSGRLFIYFMFVMMVVKHKNITDAICVTMLAFLVCAQGAFFIYLDRIQNRANVVVWLGAMMVILFCLDGIKTDAKIDFRTTIILAGVVFILNANKYYERILDYKDLQNTEAEYQERTLRIAKDSDVLYINDINQNIIDEAWSGVFDRLPDGVMFSNVVEMGGWVVNSPAWLNRMYNMGITNIFRDSVDNDRVLFITNEMRRPYIETYIHEHYNPLAKLEKVREFQDGTGYYRVVTGVKTTSINEGANETSTDLQNIEHYVRATDMGDYISIDGTAFMRNNSSYDQNVYIVSENGTSLSTLKKESSEREDDLQGKYGNFSVSVDKSIVGGGMECLNVMLVVDGIAYEIPIDEIG